MPSPVGDPAPRGARGRSSELSRAALWLGGAALVPLLAACSGAPGSVRKPPAPAPTPQFIVPAPAGLMSGTAPSLDGVVWVLAGTGAIRTLRQVDLVSRADLAVVPAPASATAVAQTGTGILGVSLATASTGALQLRAASSAALLATVALAAPAEAVAAQGNSPYLYVVTRTATSATMVVVDGVTRRVVGSAPLPLGTVAAVPAPGQGSVWALQSNGLVDEVALTNGQLSTQFRVGSSGLALAISPDGSTLYVLKGRNGVRNVAAVDLATETVTKVLAAPAGAVGLALSPDGGTLYDFVGTSAVGNVQAFRLRA